MQKPLTHTSKQLKVLQVRFDAEIQSWEISAFRGAVIAKVGREDTLLFHHHLDDQKYLYRYPLIQYKRIGKQPAILCIEEGVEEIQKFFERQDWELTIDQRTIPLQIAHLNMHQFEMQLWDEPFQYQLWNWMALDQAKYENFQQTKALSERIHLLESILRGNILAFAKGINWFIEQEVKVQILNIDSTHTVHIKGNRMVGFNLHFESNVFLPNFIGLGRKVSRGFGMVCSVKKS